MNVPDPSANRVVTIADVGADSDFVLTEGAQSINGSKTFNNTIVLSSGVNIDFQGSVHKTTITCSIPVSANRSVNIKDFGPATSAEFILSESVQTVNGAKTFSSALTVTPVTNQLILGTTNTTTISATAPASNVVYTLPDVGGSANFIMSTGTQTIANGLTITTPSLTLGSTTATTDGSFATSITFNPNAGTGSLVTSWNFVKIHKMVFATLLTQSTVSLSTTTANMSCAAASIPANFRPSTGNVVAFSEGQTSTGPNQPCYLEWQFATDGSAFFRPASIALATGIISYANFTSNVAGTYKCSFMWPCN